MVAHALATFRRLDDAVDKAGIEGRFVRPERIARAIVFLCPDAASSIPGTSATPDGGFPLTV